MKLNREEFTEAAGRKEQQREGAQQGNSKRQDVLREARSLQDTLNVCTERGTHLFPKRTAVICPFPLQSVEKSDTHFHLPFALMGHSWPL